MKTAARLQHEERPRFAARPTRAKAKAQADVEASAEPGKSRASKSAKASKETKISALPNTPGAADVEDEGNDAAVAELEAVIGQADGDDDEPAEKREAEEPSNFLAMYFKDMARLAVLRPQEEFESARKLESLEIALWVRVLTHAPVTEHALKVCERTLENSLPDFKVIRKHLGTLKKRHPKSEQEKFERVVVKTAEKVRALDTDKRILDIVLDDIHKVTHGEPGRIIDDVANFNPKSRDFKKYLSDVRTSYARAHATKNEFVKANLRLVVSIARRFNYGRMPLADLIQEGNIGLIKAVERYDYRRGYRFSTYASWWIRHAISRALADKGRAVRLPVHMIDAYHRVAKCKRELSAKLGRQPTSDEIAEVTNIPAPKIEKMRTFLLDQSFSLDRTVSDEDGRKFIDFVQDPNAENRTTADDLVDDAMTEEVRAQLDTLKPIEADILRQRFGLDTDKELTLKEIGEKYNLSRERIRQLQEQALLKMRRALQRTDLM
ncbi:MAG TPA: sigma-70 family RNA polymerase sigma factor [Polyangia bacterium]|nr:sigma-70 family RNA polymerase sigma factor [Polyangia bacterium]